MTARRRVDPDVVDATRSSICDGRTGDQARAIQVQQLTTIHTDDVTMSPHVLELSDSARRPRVELPDDAS